MKNAYYAVKTKKSKNIYTSLVDYLKHTKGVKGVVAKKFKDRKSAEDFLGLTSETKNENTQSKPESKTDEHKTENEYKADYAYVDGSYNKKQVNPTHDSKDIKTLQENYYRFWLHSKKQKT